MATLCWFESGQGHQVTTSAPSRTTRTRPGRHRTETTTTPIGWANFDGLPAPARVVNNNEFLQITAVIDRTDLRRRTKCRCDSSRTQFVSFNFPISLI